MSATATTPPELKATTSGASNASSLSGRLARSMRFGKKKKETTVVAPEEMADSADDHQSHRSDDHHSHRSGNDNNKSEKTTSKNRLRALSRRIIHPKKKKGHHGSSKQSRNGQEEDEEHNVTSTSETNPHEGGDALIGSDSENEGEERHSAPVLSRAAISKDQDVIDGGRGNIPSHRMGDSVDDDDSEDDDDDSDDSSDSSDDEDGEDKDDSHSTHDDDDDRIVLSHGKPKKMDKKHFKKKKKGKKKNSLKKKVHKSDEALFPNDPSTHKGKKKKNRKDSAKGHISKSAPISDPDELCRLESYMNKQAMNGAQFGPDSNNNMSAEAKRPSDYVDSAQAGRGDSSNTNARSVEQILMLQDYSDFYDRPDANPVYVYSENDDTTKNIIRQHLMNPQQVAPKVEEPSSLSLDTHEEEQEEEHKSAGADTTNVVEEDDPKNAAVASSS